MHRLTSPKLIAFTHHRGFSTLPKQQIGFIGLGNMGASMAGNLLKAGFPVTVYDLNSAQCDLLAGQGATVAPDVATLAHKSECVITMLPNTSHVRETILGERGILAHLHSGGIIIDSSTIDPLAVKHIHTECDKKNVLMLDAPVSGGVVGAAKGTLTFMIGAPASCQSFVKVTPFLQPMGKNFVPCGGIGLGQAAKLSNNLALAIQMVGVAEAMNLGIKLGMDKKVLASIFNTSTARSWSSDTYNPVPGVMEGVPSANNYAGGFGVDLIAKDLGLALDAGRSASSVHPVGSLVHQLYSLLSLHGYGKKDFGSVYEYLNKKE